MEWGGPAATFQGARGGRCSVPGSSPHPPSTEQESARCPNRLIQSLLKIAKCVPGGGSGGEGCLGSWPRWQAGPMPPIELWIPSTPAPQAGRVPPAPRRLPARGLGAWERPPGSRVGPKGGGPCRPGAPWGWRSCGRALALCLSADGNSARCYRQWRRAQAQRLKDAGGWWSHWRQHAWPRPPPVRAAAFLLLPQLCW